MFFYNEEGPSVLPIDGIITDNLVLHLDAGNTTSYPGTGTTWYDLSGNGNDAQITGNPLYNNENLGTLYFDGDDKAQLSDETVGDFLDTSIDFAIDAWFNAEAVFSNPQPYLMQTIFAKGLTYVSVGLTENRNIRFYWYDGGLRFVDSNVQVELNQWKQVAVTSDINGIKIYLNGQEVSTTNNGKAVFDTYYLVSSPRHISIGGPQQPTGYDRFHGKISEVKLYQSGLSPQQILQNFNATKARFGL